VRDSAGIRIIENGSIPPENRVWTVTGEPALEIGALEGDPEYQLFRVTGAHRFGDGRIVVANGGTHQLRFFDAQGRHYRSVGGEGDGPGEFQGLRLLEAFAGDSLLTFDQRQRRMAVFDSAGTYIRSVTPVGLEFYMLLGAFADGSPLLQAINLIMPDEIADGAERRPVNYHVLDVAGTTTATIGPYAGQEMHLIARADMVTINTVPFGRGAFARIAGDRVVAAANDTYSLDVYRRDGAREAVIRLAVEPQEVRPGDYEFLRDEAMASVRSDFQRQTEGESWDAMPRHETFPAFHSLMADDSGNLWVRDYLVPSDDRSLWTVFDREGTALGKVETPAGLQIFEIGDDYVLGVWEDELEVEWLRLHALEKPEGLETRATSRNTGETRP
jgi:hypothetical protein